MNDSAPKLDLLDIHGAPPPEFWPPAPGWWVLGILGIALLTLGTVWLYRRYRLYRQRKQVLAELDQLKTLDTGQQAAEFTTAVSTLLRRVALTRFTRQRVASLSGKAWLHFLDETGGGREFTTGAGQVLGQGSYVPQPKDVSADPLLLLARSWIKKNLRGST